MPSSESETEVKPPTFAETDMSAASSEQHGLTDYLHDSLLPSLTGPHAPTKPADRPATQEQRDNAAR